MLPMANRCNKISIDGSIFALFQNGQRSHEQLKAENTLDLTGLVFSYLESRVVKFEDFYFANFP